MLLNNFYKLLKFSGSGSEINASINIEPTHELFRGHFPNQPVVPGVCMIQIVKELLEKATAKKLFFSKGNQIKFLKLLVPNHKELLYISIKWMVKDNQYITQAILKNQTDIIFKLQGIFIHD